MSAFDKLIDAIWDGRMSERDFLSAGTEIGVTPAALQSVLDDLREADGVLVSEEA